MKVLIDLEDVKAFLATVLSDKDEWWGPANVMTGGCIVDYLEWTGKKKAAAAMQAYLAEIDS